MIDDGIVRVRALLAALHIKGEIIEHPGVDGSHSEDSARALGVNIGTVINCLILVSQNGSPVAAIVGGNQRLDVKKLEDVTSLKKLSFASAAVIEQLTGFKAGGIPPIAVLGKMPAFIDMALLSKDFVIGSAGTPRAGLKLSPLNLVDAGFIPMTLC
nr:YbaK/EbsC family protein [Candidatus Sigynarchaeota archaeon]